MRIELFLLRKAVECRGDTQLENNRSRHRSRKITVSLGLTLFLLKNQRPCDTVVKENELFFIVALNKPRTCDSYLR